MNTKKWSAGLVLAIIISVVAAPGQAQNAAGGVPAALAALQAQIQAMENALIALQAQVANAGDGVVLINQSRALAGNVTPGDDAGYPVSITQPGSYRLSGNLMVPAGSMGIEISADDVTLDLNGFTISGGGNSATAVRELSALSRIAVANGVISEFGSGVNMLTSAHVTVHDLRSANLSGFSVVTGQYATIQRNNVQGLIQADCPSVITENVTEGFITVNLTSGDSSPQCVRWNNRSLNFEDAVTQ